jgi:hypothetical protein
MFRNKLINGGFDIWQRGASITQVADIGNTNSYTADRWRAGAVRDGVAWRQITFARESVNVPDDTRYAAKFTLGAADCNRADIVHRIEAANSFQFKNKAGVLSFKLRRIATLDASALLKISIRSPDSEDNYSSSTARGTQVITGMSSLSNSSYTSFSVDIPANAAFANGMEVTISWQTAAFTTPLAGIGDFFYIGSVQLELGTIATPFEQRPYSQVLDDCLYYYEKSVFTDLTGVTFTQNGDTRCRLPLRKGKRRVPDVAYSGSVGVIAFGETGSVTNVSLGTLTISASLKVEAVHITAISNFAAFSGAGATMTWGSRDDITIIADAEL